MSESQVAPRLVDGDQFDRTAWSLAEPAGHVQKLAGIGRFANVIAHDFNNLLAVIRAYAEMALRERTLDAGIREQLEAIRGAADSATWLAQQLLVHTRRNSGRASLLDLNLMLRDVHQLLGRSLPAGRTSELRLQENLPPIFADPGPVAQLLLSAVAKAMDGLPADGRLVIESFEHARTQPDSSLPRAAAPRLGVGVRVSGTTSGVRGPLADARDPLPSPRLESPAPAGAGPIDDAFDSLAAAADIVLALQGDISVTGDAHAGWVIDIAFPGVSALPMPAEYSKSGSVLFSASEGHTA